MISLIYPSFYHDNSSSYTGRVPWNVSWFFQKIYHRLISKHVYHNRSSSFTVSFFNNYLERKKSLEFTFLKISIINRPAKTKGLL